MRARDRKRHQLGRFWLYQRPDTGTWSICWLDPGTGLGGSGRAVTRRKATAAAGGSADQPPQAALDALAAHHLEHGQQRKLPRAEAVVESLIADWLKYHVADLAAPERYVGSALLLADFFDRDARAGRSPAMLTVADVTPAFVQRFIRWRREAGVGGHTISRDLAALRGALNWAWKNNHIESAPFIADVPATQKAAPRDRVLSFAELAALLEACRGKPDREHVVRFVVIELGTAGRPEAVLELTAANIDLERNLIDPNQAGRRHLRKRRPVVPIALHVRPWVEDAQGKLIRYRAPIAERNQLPGGPTHFERDTASIKTAWWAICAEAGLVDTIPAAIAGDPPTLKPNATPKTLRHTMLTWLATRGVPKEERMALAGHAATDTTARNYEHLTPAYLQGAIREIDAFFGELTKLTNVHLRSGYDPLAPKLRLVG